MNIIPNDLVYEICFYLSYRDLIAFCNIKSNLNVCNNRVFWLNKIQYDQLPIDFNYNELTSDELRKIYKYYSMAIELLLYNKKKVIEKGISTIKYKLNNLNDIIAYLPKQSISNLGIIDNRKVNIILVFSPKNSFKINIFYNHLFVIQLTEQEVINLIAYINQNMDLH